MTNRLAYLDRAALAACLFVLATAGLVACAEPGPVVEAPGTSATDAVSSTAVPAVPVAGACHARQQGGDPRMVLPDPACTPGAVNPDVTQDDISSTICRTGFTTTIRPPASYTEALKRRQMAAYGFTDSIRLHEEDHLISLELGGASSDPRNLWPEPGASPNPKDGVENRLHALVCAGQLPLQTAQRAIATDWVDALARYGSQL